MKILTKARNDYRCISCKIIVTKGNLCFKLKPMRYNVLCESCYYEKLSIQLGGITINKAKELVNMQMKVEKMKERDELLFDITGKCKWGATEGHRVSGIPCTQDREVCINQ
tara:strand:+ start:462 stop:794 length:333 start_codon:yes stop_codon:yes gene_type:complete